ncbi:CRISPR-associated protein Csx20 [Terrisporobacter mayombei]|uniref:CRISPR-associated protein n=1 Tax=Terrisporobacter mayombei TaxID=1541 RepID=A0ABY9PYC1_9FIRM|nr:CRISPR-associated protein Csx20 [Terrisporobacter mayombei]MCC3867936.1 hypothetical protein [Terrisporobacter mayombei]WMT80070.1 hypothetical protein TEMA_03470 [Terrisporobacter mayombei]
MKKLIVLMSHDITDFQIEDAYKTFNINRIVEADTNIKEIWANINPKSSLDLTKLDLVINWIEKVSNKNDFILVQGEFGATFYIVDYCFKKDLIPVYSTSKRQVLEHKDGEKIITNRIFSHQGFRKYEIYVK